jgi:iron-sulfur cluster assembly 1
MRLFSAYQGPHRSSSRRDMQTATAYRPKTLSDSFPPAPNTGIPDAFIAYDGPLSKNSNNSTAQSNVYSDITAEKGVHEGEARQSRHTTPSAKITDTTQLQGPMNPRRTKLRPRRAAMTLTPTAIEHLHRLLSQPDPKMIRVGVKNRGCSGLAYHLEYVEKPGKFDEVVEQDGVKVLIDSKALFSIIGSVMDWQEDKLSHRFVFRNPNISKFSLRLGEKLMKKY